MTSTTVRALNNGGAFVTLRTMEQGTFIQIDNIEECQSNCTKNYLKTLARNNFNKSGSFSFYFS